VASKQLGIIADDLSGAIECAAVCRRMGHQAVVLPSVPESNQPGQAHASVIVVVTDSRHLPSITASQRLNAAARWLMRQGIHSFYKKTDSAARGPLAAELAALARVEPTCAVYFVPAFPRLGRTVTDGILYIDGVPVAETAFAKDPRSPIHTSSLLTLLRQQTDVPVTQACRKKEASATLVLCDGTTDDDVHTSVDTAQRRGARLAGPAGALEALLPHLDLDVSEPLETRVDRSSVLIVAGSCHPVTQAQINHAESAGACVIHLVPPCSMENHPLPDSSNTFITMTQDAWRQHRPVILCTARRPVDVDVALAAARQQGLDIHVYTEQITQYLVATATRLLHTLHPSLITVCGGATSQGMIDALGINRLTLLREIEPGIGLCRTHTGHMLAIKNGAFGKVDALTNHFSPAPLD
jgi:uncharacterized protein YgbK (DUF1537 family)